MVTIIHGAPIILNLITYCLFREVGGHHRLQNSRCMKLQVLWLTVFIRPLQQNVLKSFRFRCFVRGKRHTNWDPTSPPPFFVICLFVLSCLSINGSQRGLVSRMRCGDALIIRPPSLELPSYGQEQLRVTLLIKDCG